MSVRNGFGPLMNSFFEGQGTLVRVDSVRDIREYVSAPRIVKHEDDDRYRELTLDSEAPHRYVTVILDDIVVR